MTSAAGGAAAPGRTPAGAAVGAGDGRDGPADRDAPTLAGFASAIGSGALLSRSAPPAPSSDAAARPLGAPPPLAEAAAPCPPDAPPPLAEAAAPRPPGAPAGWSFAAALAASCSGVSHPASPSPAGAAGRRGRGEDAGSTGRPSPSPPGPPRAIGDGSRAPRWAVAIAPPATVST
ncbi:MAG TPA: hypothetical protein VFS00_27875, partial [Polyangiaceae bacterium]|nr:hypothetical protein [Polyangiaceae bacterium]